MILRSAPQRLTYDSNEIYWRVANMQIWQHVLVQRPAHMRDYADWAGPFVKRAALQGWDYVRFWMLEVESDRMPRIRLRALMEKAQLGRKFTHGNPADIQHASYLLDSDLLLTADKGFHEAVRSLGGVCPGTGTALLVDGSAPSALGAIRASLSAVYDRPD